MLELKVIRRISRAEGTFTALLGEEKLICHLYNKEDWDKVSPNTTIMVKGSIMSTGHFLVLSIIDTNLTAVMKEKKVAKREMYKNWAFHRILGLRDIPTMFKIFAARRRAKKLQEAEASSISSPKHLGEIHVGYDVEIDYWIEPMAAGTESCPYWDTSRLFYGREMNFSIEEKPMEFFLGIRQTCLAPIIPIPICSYEEVYILGTSDEPFRACLKKYGKARCFHDHPQEFGAVKIFDEKTTWFIDSDKKYKNDPIFSTCG